MTGRTLKQRLASRELTVGSWLTTDSPTIAELMAQQDFDWLVVDTEHSCIDLSATWKLVQLLQRGGTPALVRVGENDANLIKRTMDSGADGVIVPMVCTPEEAEQAVASVHYPPTGKRGVGLARAQGYGFGFDTYRKKLADDAIVLVQIEHYRGVENLEAIMNTPGVDGYVIGMYDLSGSLGAPGRFDHPDVVAALEHVQVLSKRHSYLRGIHVVPTEFEHLERAAADGYRFIAHGLDTIWLGNALKADAADRESLREKIAHGRNVVPHTKHPRVA